MNTEALSIQSPKQYLETLPEMIGFAPEDSAVLTWLNDGTVAVTQRVDLADALSIDGWRQVLMPMRQHSFDAVILSFWGDADRDDLDTFIGHVQAETHVQDALHVDDGRWWSLSCNDPECCPPEGYVLNVDMSTTRASIEAEWQFPAPPKGTGRLTRETVNDALAEDLELARDQFIDTIVDGWVTGTLPEGTPYMLADIRVRDVLLWHMTAVFDAEQWMEAYREGLRLVKQVRPKYAAPIATVAALCAWQAGDGVRASLASDYAASCDAGYSLNMLAKAAISSGMDPNSWKAAMSSVTLETCRNGDKA